MPNFFPEGMPVPVGDLISQPFWDGLKQHQFLVQRCARCGAYRYPPEAVCWQCHSFDSIWEPSAGVGEVFTYEVVHSPNHPAVRAIVPFNIVVVQLIDCGQVKLTTNLVNVKNEDIHIGLKVQVVYEDTVPGEITQHRFQPVQG